LMRTQDLQSSGWTLPATLRPQPTSATAAKGPAAVFGAAPIAFREPTGRKQVPSPAMRCGVDSVSGYHRDMIRLTREQAEEAERHPAGLRVEADGSTKTFVLVEEELLQRMRRAFERRQPDESLARAIAQMEAGEGR